MNYMCAEFGASISSNVEDMSVRAPKLLRTGGKKQQSSNFNWHA